MSAEKAPVPVVCAVIVNTAGLVLVAQRPPHKHLGLKWEFPGGKVEPGERPERALAREIAEELGCEIEIGRRLPHVTHDYGSVTIEMIPFVCGLRAGSAAHPREHVAVAWLPVAELRGGAVDLAPADVPVLQSL
jgi:8-oxo-dGTP diphosphatase